MIKLRLGCLEAFQVRFQDGFIGLDKNYFLEINEELAFHLKAAFFEMLKLKIFISRLRDVLPIMALILLIPRPVDRMYLTASINKDKCPNR
jgi:hypothetical protein